MKRREFIKETTALGLGAGLGKQAFAAQSKKESPGESQDSFPTGPTSAMSGRMQSEWRWYSTEMGVYALPTGINLFTDGRYIDPGYLDWVSADGERLSAVGSGTAIKPGPYEEAYALHAGVPEGVTIRCQPATVSDPLPDIMSGNLVYENGMYRLWYAVSDDRCWYLPQLAELADKDPQQMVKIKRDWEKLLLYAESSDGFHWKLPKLNLIDPKEYAVNRVVFDNAVFGCSKVVHGNVKPETWKLPTVFVDPYAPVRERYKMVYGVYVGRRTAANKEVAVRMFNDYRKRWPNEFVDPAAIKSIKGSWLPCLMGATSPDGLHWTTIPEPLALHLTDGDHFVDYDETINKYVWYARRNWWCGHRRGIGRAETDDFRHFPGLELIVHPQIGEGLDADWYTPGKTMYPGTRHQYLMFPSQFRRSDESGVVQMFSSPDGIHWDRVPGGPVVTHAPLGQPHDTWIRYVSNMVPLPGDRVGIMLDGQLKPHKYPRQGGKRSQEEFRYMCYWAMWPKGRLAAVEADGYGSFSTAGLKVEGRKLILNLHTKAAGEVRVEVAKTGEGYAQGEPIRGRTFADCDPIHGDQPSHTVTWRGQPDMGFGEKQPIVLRFQMRMAKIFSFEVV